MYEVKINNSLFDIVDLYEVNTILTKKTVEKSEYLEKLKKEIFELYYKIFIKMTNESMVKELIKYQLLIDKAYSYLLDGKGEFEKYFEQQEIKVPEIDKLYKKILDNQRVEPGFCFNPIEIKENQKVIDIDKIGFFYFFAFTIFYLDNYLLHQMAMFPQIFKKRGYNKEDINTFHINMIKIFSEDFSEGFRLFETEVVENNVS